jgi:hypothetical protein
MSRRDNGLHATSYARVLDVDSPVVDGLLERLRDEEVAAYVAPAPGQRGPYGDTVLPVTPRDSVYVDAERRDHARAVIDRYLEEIREEMAWATLVAGFDDPAEDEVPRWPASEDVPAEVDPDPDAAVRGRVLRPAETSIGFEELRDVVGAVAREEPEDHFQPPTPPPIPLPDTISRAAWAALLGGPLFLIIATIFDLDVSGWAGLLALGAFVGGFVTLVARMEDRPPNDLGGDDGAVV